MNDPGELLFSQIEDGQTRFALRLVGEPVWPSLANIKGENADATTAQEYDEYSHTLNTQQAPVIVHFDEAVKKAKQFAHSKRKKRTDEERET